MDKIVKYRRQIDRIDQSLIRLLAKRMASVTEIGKIKKTQGLKPYDPKRWNQVLDSRIQMGLRYGLSQSFIEQIFSIIHIQSLYIEKKHEYKTDSSYRRIRKVW